MSKDVQAFLPKTSRDRYWLPGSPPRRRLKDLGTVERLLGPNDYLPDLRIPVRPINLWSFENRESSTLGPYFKRRGHFGDKSRRNEEEALYLFHGCATEISPDLLHSFARHGPSIHFSRPQSYFSRAPAVYWTDSLDFAFAWCVFSETGRWIPDITPGSKPFECLVYVSKVDAAILANPGKCFHIAEPDADHMEMQLVDWCNANMEKSNPINRIPPPGSDKADWSVISSRIPKHTMESLVCADFPDMPALGKTEVRQMWMYAACDETSSSQIASAGIEILHLFSHPADMTRPKL
ncbi:hypothetical protein K458DRAFT_393427 [Lentithecium fluviatile CBS 122367]|uniref:Uncharacterized protein n=1 Tax=Lentithecium fluviatile CBS 122367 TaxID=1168545 RepID=A0A6G1IPF2_9PLEO|nr:hypothetical protein K458DRAFT_393427 [Lentithecium fluviatile CBS 122367]